MQVVKGRKTLLLGFLGKEGGEARSGVSDLIDLIFLETKNKIGSEGEARGMGGGGIRPVARRGGARTSPAPGVRPGTTKNAESSFGL